MSAAGAVIIIDVVSKTGTKYKVAIDCGHDVEENPKLVREILHAALEAEKAKHGDD